MVVPNTRLLNDHQTELAKHLGNEGYAIRSSSKCVYFATTVPSSLHSRI